ncbi:MAG: biopolymer transporter ExbD [Microscillaceae bacterium]|jgi:biopolymer transport protein ExbD|nr:biopolymer transporter ExbD [Microscillaceae bacterium]
MVKKKRQLTEINASSMADIAFLLLIFFLVTTTIAADKGLPQILPPKRTESTPPMHWNNRNLLRILINSQNQLLVEDEILEITALRTQVKEFVANPQQNPNLPETPKKAIISIKTDRKTQYATFIAVLNEVKAAYHDLRAQALGVSTEEYLQWDEQKLTPKQIADYEQVKKKYPMQISEAEPSQVL